MEGFRIFLFALVLVCQCQWAMSNNCKKGFFDNGKGGCEACGCCSLGSTKTECDNKGVCTCKPEYDGEKCSDCSDGYWLVKTRCQKCGCNLLGSISVKCNLVGRCKCKDSSFQGDKCLCPNGNYVKNDKCLPCGCNPTGSANATCTNGAGQCPCLPGYEGAQCNTCSDGYFLLNGKCTACNCKPGGSTDIKCDGSGQCNCKPGNNGTQCESCLNGYFLLGDGSCRDCQCKKAGTRPGEFCDANGICPCKVSHSGVTCENCNKADGYRKIRGQCRKPGKKPAKKPGNKPSQQGGSSAQPGGSSAQNGCAKCVKKGLKACNKKTKFKCTCKNNFGPPTCGQCKPNFYLKTPNANKCEVCGCLRHGQLKPCHANGTCICKPAYNGNSKCKKCAQGYKKQGKFCKKIATPGASSAQPGGSSAQKGGSSAKTGCAKCVKKGTRRCNKKTKLKCICKNNFAPPTCGQCKPNFQLDKTKKKCIKKTSGAQPGGSSAQPGGSSAQNGCAKCVKKGLKACNKKTKYKCQCKNNFGPPTCGKCKPNFYQKTPNANKCEGCKCNRRGQLKPCHANGTCICKPVYAGPKCKKCIKGYNYKKGRCIKAKPKKG